MGIIRAITSSTVAAIATVVMLAAPQLASAQATRTWVSGVGDDANPCSRTAPCKTFAGAISKTATNGEINCIDAGAYGTDTITKSIVLDCKGFPAGILNYGTHGIIVNVPAASNVTLRNLDINGAGGGLSGIRVLSATSVHIDKVTIRSQTGNGIDVLSSIPTHVTVTNTIIRESAQHGISVAPTSGATAKLAVSFSTMADNGFTGVRLNDNSTASVSDSLLTGNGTSGAAASSTGAGATLTLDRVVSSGNREGGVLAKGPGAIVWLSNTLMSGNAYGFYPAVGGGTYVSFGNNRVVGNASDGVPTQVVSQL